MAIPYGPTNFHSTVVKPYYTEEASEDEQQCDPEDKQHYQTDRVNQSDNDTEPIIENNQVQNHG